MRSWEGPLYEVHAVAVDLGWRMHCEVHRAVEFDGELVVDDPDGIVVDAAFLPVDTCTDRLAACFHWVREPLVDWLRQRWGPDRPARVPLRRSAARASTTSRCSR